MIFLDFEKPIEELHQKIQELRHVQTEESALDISKEIDTLASKLFIESQIDLAVCIPTCLMPKEYKNFARVVDLDLSILSINLFADFSPNRSIFFRSEYFKR